MNKTTEALKLAEEALLEWMDAFDRRVYDKDTKALAAIREALAEPVTISCDCGDIYERNSFGGKFIQQYGCCPNCDAAEPVKQEPVARPFECWSTNDGDSWFEHPADAQLIYDVLGDDPKVGDEFEVSAGWNCVTATYQIASKDGDDFEVKCVSHPNNDTAPVYAKAIRAEALEEAAKWCEAKQSYSAMHANTEFAAGIRGLK